MLTLNVGAFTKFQETDSNEDIEQLEEFISTNNVTFESRKHGIKGLCVLLGIKTKAEFEDVSYVINTVLKNMGHGKEA